MILFYYIQFYFTQFNTKKSLTAIFLIKCLKEQQQQQELLRAVDRFSLTEIGKNGISDDQISVASFSKRAIAIPMRPI